MSYGLHLIQNPSGTFSFVGSVPLRLAYLNKAGDFVTAEYVDGQLRLPAKYREIVTRSFLLVEEAQAAARLLGYNVDSVVMHETRTV